MNSCLLGKEGDFALSEARQNRELSQSSGAEGSLFSNTAITSHLEECLIERDYPETSLKSLKRCGLDTGFKIFRACECGTDYFSATWNCNSRICPRCALKRKRRLKRRFLPILNDYNQPHQTHRLLFLTISPLNYESFEDGIKHIKASFSKFIRRKYIHERVEGGFYVVEAKTQNSSGERKGWNIHIHCIIYAKYLDNVIRGHCNKCMQNYIKYDYNSKKHYCGNSKCHSSDVVVSGDSTLVKEWKASSGGREVNIHISRLGSALYTLNYLLKYISSNKDDFSSDEDLADYTCGIRKQKLINAFGIFFKTKSKGKTYEICYNCGDKVTYWSDNTILRTIIEEKEAIAKRPPNLEKYMD